MRSGEVREGKGGEKRIKGEGRKGTEGERGGDRTNEEERREKQIDDQFKKLWQT